MPDWTKSMKQTYEYYIVDPGTWKDLKKIDVVKNSSIKRDSTVETRGSASFDVTEKLTECYVRTYLVTVQNGVTEKHALGTHLVQTPSSKFDGRVTSLTLDGYTSLLELRENKPAIGYFIPKDSNVMEQAYMLVRDHTRAPVIKAECPSKTPYDFVADTGDTWIAYISDFISNQIFEDTDKNLARISQYRLDVDELGQILFAPVQDVITMQPVWTYTDDNSSILYPQINMEHDLYGIPNVVEVVYTGAASGGSGINYYYVRVENNDPNSPISTVSRGREIVYRDLNPSLGGIPTKRMISEYARQLLESISTLQCKISYTHGYCPVRVGDCVRLNYSRAGITDVKAKIISQDIKCVPGCPVSETAEFSIKLWTNKVKFLNEKGEPVNEKGELVDDNGNVIENQEEGT